MCESSRVKKGHNFHPMSNLPQNGTGGGVGTSFIKSEIDFQRLVSGIDFYPQVFSVFANLQLKNLVLLHDILENHVKMSSSIVEYYFKHLKTERKEF